MFAPILLSMLSVALSLALNVHKVLGRSHYSSVDAYVLYNSPNSPLTLRI